MLNLVTDLKENRSYLHKFHLLFHSFIPLLFRLVSKLLFFFKESFDTVPILIEVTLNLRFQKCVFYRKLNGYPLTASVIC